jgi:phosphonate transport system permease protein
MNGSERTRRGMWWAVLLAVLISLYFSARATGARPSVLFDPAGWESAKGLMSGLFNPDLSPDFIHRIIGLSFQSILIGVVGTVLGALIGVSLAFAAADIPDLPFAPPKPLTTRIWNRTVRTSARFTLTFFRTVPDLVWAYLFVRMMGLGPGPGVLAIGVASGGAIGKLFGELAESVDPRPVQALAGAGASRFGILVYSVLPQVRRQWIAYGLFRLECAIRSATILGVVGAGGLGEEIDLAIRYFQYEKLATALLAVLVIVIGIEAGAMQLRRARSRQTVLVGLAGALLGIIFLDLSAFGSISGGGASQWLTIEHIVGAAAIARRAFVLTAETVVMAWIATLFAAVFGFVAASVAASSLATGGSLQDSYKPGPLQAGSMAVLRAVSRLLMQTTRAMPELTLALIFVVWVGPGPFAGVLAISVHTIGVLGRLYSDAYEDVDPAPLKALEANGVPAVGRWLFGVFPQVSPRTLAYTLYRFEVNIRNTAVVGFVGAGGIGDLLHTSITLFHFVDLFVQLGVMLAVVTTLDAVGSRIRAWLLRVPVQVAKAPKPKIPRTPSKVARAAPGQRKLRGHELSAIGIALPQHLQAPPRRPTSSVELRSPDEDLTEIVPETAPDGAIISAVVHVDDPTNPTVSSLDLRRKAKGDDDKKNAARGRGR